MTELLCSCGRWPIAKRGKCPSCYNASRNRLIAYGQWESNLVPAAPVRAHIAELQATGMSRGQIYRLADIPRTTFYALLYGRDGEQPTTHAVKTTADAVLSVRVPRSVAELIAVSMDRDPVPAIGARRRLQALVANGWRMSYLAEELDITRQAFHPLIHRKERVRLFRHRQIADLFARLQLDPGPSDEARAYAQKQKWPLPFQWDEEEIDELNARPVSGSRRRVRQVA
ncbi:hypothetical protein [Nocardia sp. NPDC019302]|uniref:hypothetical protein n=1 Tax=Nocardia sp. NPDC019302 TaxID=3154592 RepID=UPI0033D41D5E